MLSSRLPLLPMLFGSSVVGADRLDPDVPILSHGASDCRCELIGSMPGDLELGFPVEDTNTPDFLFRDVAASALAASSRIPIASIATGRSTCCSPRWLSMPAGA
jgi:hypothetical protein